MNLFQKIWYWFHKRYCYVCSAEIGHRWPREGRWNRVCLQCSALLSDDSEWVGGVVNIWCEDCQEFHNL